MTGNARPVRRVILLIVLLAVAMRALRAIGVPPLSRYVVEGPSMEPAFRSGDRVLVNRLAYRSRAPRDGEVVVLRDPERAGHILLKRVAVAPGDRGPSPTRVYVLGDNAAESRDSRAFGTVEIGQIIGRAWMKY
jgi:nickel-type superoxide dismutase maturation protease